MNDNKDDNQVVNNPQIAQNDVFRAGDQQVNNPGLAHNHPAGYAMENVPMVNHYNRPAGQAINHGQAQAINRLPYAHFEDGTMRVLVFRGVHLQFSTRTLFRGGWYGDLNGGNFIILYGIRCIESLFVYRVGEFPHPIMPAGNGHPAIDFSANIPGLNGAYILAKENFMIGDTHYRMMRVFWSPYDFYVG